MKSYDRLLAAIVLSALMLTSVFTYEMSAQNQRIKVTVSGHITDKASGETLIGAGVLTEGAGAATNNYGFYTLTIPQGRHLTLRYSYVGYDDATVTLDLLRDTTINVALKANTELKEAVVSAQRESGIMATKMSAIEIPMNMIKNTPVLFGEADVLKTIQLMPGVQSGAEGFSGIYVRGGGPDENLLLLDGISLYNAEHMLGLFSIFQPEAVKKVTLYKGSFPARYGGRTSSIIDVRTNDGNLHETHGTVGVGVLSDKFHLEGPIFKGKTAYSISARGMHTFLFDGIFRAANIPANYYFFDFNGKVPINSATRTGCSSTPIMDETYSTTKTMKAMSSSTGSRTKPSSTTKPTSDGETFSHPQDGITSSTEGCFRTRLWPSRTTGCEWATTLRKRVRTRNIPTSSIMVPE